MSRHFDSDIELEGSITLPPKEAVKGKAMKKRPYGEPLEGLPRRNGNGKANGKARLDWDDDDSDDGESSEIDEWAEDDEDMDPEAMQRRNRMKLIKQHLMLLAEDSIRFLRSEGNRGMGEWSVNYKELGKTLRSLELEKIVEERFEGVGTRLLRIIKDKGKLDEKQVPALAFPLSFFLRTLLLTDGSRSPISRSSSRTRSGQCCRGCRNAGISNCRKSRAQSRPRSTGRTFCGTLTKTGPTRCCCRTCTRR